MHIEADTLREEMGKSSPNRYRRSVLLCALVFAMVIASASCATAGFQIERVESVAYEPSSSIELIRLEPRRPYAVLAKFSGTELSFCRRDESYCTLRKQARDLGANAIWLQQTRVSVRPEQWVTIDGRMTRIPAANYETIDGVLIRYRD